MNRNKYLTKNIILLAIGNFGTRAINFILVPLYTDVLTTSEYGTIDLVTTIAVLIVPLITFDIGEAVMRFSLDKDADVEQITRIGSLFAIISCLIGLIIIPAFTAYKATSRYSIYIYLYCISQGIEQISICNLKGREQLLDFSIANIINALSTGILNIIFLTAFREEIQGYFKAYILANFITSVYAIVRGKAYKLSLHNRLDVALIKEMIKYSVLLIPTSLMWWIINSSDRIMVTGLLGESANGIYAVSYKIPSILSVASAVFNQAWSFSAIKEEKSEDAEDYNNKIFDFLFSNCLIISALLLAFIQPIMYIYVGENFYEAWKYTPYLIIGFCFSTMGSFLATSYTVSKNSKGFLLSGMSGAIANIILNFVLIPIIGISGAALATCISYITTFIYRYIDTRKYIKIDVFKTKYVLQMSIIVLISFTLFIDNQCIEAILISIETCSILLLNRNFIKNCAKLLKNKIRKKSVNNE